MTDNMREALRLQQEKSRLVEEQGRSKVTKTISTIGKVLGAIATIAILAA